MYYAIMAQVSGAVMIKRDPWETSQGVATILIEASSPTEAVSKLCDVMDMNGTARGLLKTHVRRVSAGVSWGGPDHTDHYASVTAEWAPNRTKPTITTK